MDVTHAYSTNTMWLNIKTEINLYWVPRQCNYKSNSRWTEEKRSLCWFNVLVLSGLRHDHSWSLLKHIAKYSSLFRFHFGSHQVCILPCQSKQKEILCNVVYYIYCKPIPMKERYSTVLLMCSLTGYCLYSIKENTVGTVKFLGLYFSIVLKGYWVKSIKNWIFHSIFNYVLFSFFFFFFFL